MNYNSFTYDTSQMQEVQNFIYVSIVIIGTQQHSSSTWRNIMPGVDVGSNSKFMFVHQAIRTVRLNIIHKWCVLLCDEGYTAQQQNIIKQTFYSIENNCHGKVVIDFQTISSPQDIVNYINGAENRKQKIEKLYFYSHGVVKKILPWMKGIREQEAFDESVVKDISHTVFTHSAKIYSYACRTGLGNPEIDEDRIITRNQWTTSPFAWARKEVLPLMLDQSLAQKMSNISHAVVYAYLRRTDYSNTLFTSDEYDFMDAYEHVRLGTRSRRSSKRYNSMMRRTTTTKAEDKRYKTLCTVKRTIRKIDGAAFLSRGARYPVFAAETPRNTSSVIQLYKP